MISVLIGITHAGIAQQNLNTKKHMLIAHAFSFLLNHLSWQKIQYNLGRMYQQFGINHIASFHYKKVINYMNPLIEQHPKYLDLKRQATYNLHRQVI